MFSERFERAYNALLDAYNNNTLAKNSCTACAVGNIVASALNAEVTRRIDEYGFIEFKCDLDNRSWYRLIGYDFYLSSSARQRAIEAITLTGYSVSELKEVERLFEDNTRIGSMAYKHYSEKEIKQDQYKGLVAVVDYLLSLEEVEQTIKDTKEAQFSSKLKEAFV